ncbi:hypothetical protein EC912_102271 [Luteibacter rhizovicinus]|uniref:Uncharacterized protein n=1 Tax=Luteibacter rhizovicinus TaxID=242606 RepID=A0A4R3YTY9_9GAMM|nr:hypothetical protein [Luteibacter rhizovicinus]TCV95926.1 hypothetical protein EC912_102271 [Luteibacter rhizovicinus]
MTPKPPKKPRRWHRLHYARRPRDASHDYNDADYDGGNASGGLYLRHVIALGAAIVVIVVVVRWLIG